MKVMISYVCFENHWRYRKIFEIKDVGFVKINILCCIHFLCASDSFREKRRQC